MHVQAVIAGTRVPVSVILDCLAAGMTAEQVTAEHPTVTTAGVRAAAAYGTALALEELVPVAVSRSRWQRSSACAIRALTGRPDIAPANRPSAALPHATHNDNQDQIDRLPGSARIRADRSPYERVCLVTGCVSADHAHDPL
jgi:uncharacterized protein (DUF433 family)